MKRALAILAACSLFGFAGLAQFSGEWDTNIHVLPSLSLDYTKLTLNYDVAGWTFSGVATFSGSTFSDMDFSVSGTLGAITIEGSMAFDPTGPAYESSSVSASLDFAGVSFGLDISHTVQTSSYKYCLTDSVAEMVYALSVAADPISADITFVDCCSGIYFHDLSVTLSGISLCCGVTYDATFVFTKAEGFDSLTFEINDVFPICCGISFDIAVTFTTEGKTISLTPKLAGIGEACFELYADLEKSGGSGEDLYLNGIRVDGWKIYCELAECNYIEFVSFLSPDNADLYGYPEGTYEYVKLGFCGPGCCGGEYSVDIAVNFTKSTALFGIDSISANVSLPLMENFVLNISFSSNNNLDIGWTFTF
jgi:hypothetical protein